MASSIRVRSATQRSCPPGDPFAGQTCKNTTAGQFDGKLKCNENCTLDKSECTVKLPKCGDKLVEGDEQCDDKSTFSNADCLPTCKFNLCGDGHLNTQGPKNFEQCDDANQIDQDGCSAKCQLEFCGDQVVQEGLNETCDDGQQCQNGKVCEVSEQCKGIGDQKCLPRGGDGCSPTCQLEAG